MNIIRADFDWTSLLVIVVAGIFGLIKSQAKKNQERPMPRTSEFPADEPMDVGRYTNTEKEVKEEISLKSFVQEKELPGDYCKPEEIHTTPIEEQEEEIEAHRIFDIRQAVVSSEILRRPEY